MAYTPENNPYIPGDPYSYDLKWIVEEVKTALSLYQPLHDEFTDLSGDFTELHDYVMDYFASLDLSQEVSDKLDQMAEDGTLDALIQPLFDAYKAEIDGDISAQNAAINVLQARMDTFASLPAGSTTGDAELIDIRVGVNGMTYSSAGAAVRKEAGSIAHSLSTGIKNITGYTPIVFYQGGYLQYYNSGGNIHFTPVLDDNRACALVPAVAGDSFRVSLKGGGGVFLAWGAIDSDGNVLLRSSLNYERTDARITMPENTAWFALNTVIDFDYWAYKLADNETFNLKSVVDENAANIETMRDEIDALQENKFASLKVLVLGDSIARGGRNSSKGFIGDVGCQYVNIAVGGSCLSNKHDSSESTDTPHPMGASNIPDQIIKYAEQTAESWYMIPDVIIADGGINDMTRADLGTVPQTPARTDTEAAALPLDTVIGGLEYLLYNMIKLYPHAQKFFLISSRQAGRPWNNSSGENIPYNQTELHDAIKKTCELYSITVIDIFDRSNANSYFNEYVSPVPYNSDHSVGELYYFDNDRIHPLSLGYKNGYVPFVKEALENFLQ